MFIAQRGELARIRAFVEDFCARTGFPREGGLRLNVVLEELFVNTVTHGHRGDKDAPVWVTLDQRPPGVRVTYDEGRDAGRRFRDTTCTSPSIESVALPGHLDLPVSV